LTHPTYTILIVDELRERGGRSCRQIVKQVLEQVSRPSYQVLAAAYEDNILEQCQSHKVDAVLIVSYGPHQEGLALLDLCQTQINNQINDQINNQLGDYQSVANVPFLIICSDDAASARRAFKQGAADYLTYDQLTEEQLTEAITSAIDGAIDGATYQDIESILHKSEAKYRALFESIDEGCVLLELLYDEDGQAIDIFYLDANPAAIRIVGIEKLANQRAKELFPTLEDYWIETCDRVLKTGVGEQLEQPIADLEAIYDVYFSKVSGESEQVVAVFTDVTERRQTARILARSINLNNFRIALSDALRPLSDPLEIQAVASQVYSSYIRVSRAFYFEVTGESGEYYSVRGSGYIDGVEMVPVGDYPAEAYSRKVYNRLAQGETVVISDVEAESYLNADQLAAYAHFEIAAFIAVPILKKGKFVAALSTNMNRPRVWTPEEITIAEEMAERTWSIVERARAETAVVSDLKHMRLLRDLSARAVDEDNIEVLYGEIVEIAIALTKAKGGTLRMLKQGTQKLSLLAQRGFPQHIASRIQCLEACSQGICDIESGECCRTFIEFATPEGEPTDDIAQQHIEAGFLYAQATPLISRNGNLIGMVATHWPTQYQPTRKELRFVDLLARQAADLIEQRQAEAVREQLLVREKAARQTAEHANRVKDNFLAILSHELRTPLNPIMVWSQLLLSREIDPATTKKAYETIQRNAKLQIQLVDDLLDVAKILRGKLEIEESAVNLAEVIQASIDVVKISAEVKALSIAFTQTNIRTNTQANTQTNTQPNSAENYTVKGSATRLQQVIWNLLSNAIKFTPSGGRIDIQLTAENGQAVVSISDTGKGIQPNFLPHLFESFQQEDTSITRTYGGLGLGLSIVKYIVDAHGGTITATSLGEGKGATFTLRLPLLNDSAAAASQAPSKTKADLAGIKVLAVDDNEDARNLLHILLEMHGAQVKTVDSGMAMLESIETFAPNILLCDIAMPDMDGYTLLKHIQALPSQQNHSTPSIALTAYAQEEERQKSLEIGFQRHITKPVDPETLVDAIVELTH